MTAHEVVGASKRKSICRHSIDPDSIRPSDAGDLGQEPPWASVACSKCDVSGDVELTAPVRDDEVCRASPDGRHVIAPHSIRPDDGGDFGDGPPRASVECDACDVCGDVELTAPVWDE